MLFKSVIVSAAATMVGCGVAREVTDENSTVDALRLYSHASASVLDVGEDTVFLDSRIGHIVRLGTDPIEFKDHAEIPVDAGSSWILSESDGNFFVSISGDHYSIFSSNGLKLEDPIEIDEDIAGVAWSPGQRTLLVEDELGAFTVIQLSETGDVSESFQGEANFSQEEAFVSGTMLDTGFFIAALGESTIAMVDLASTLENQSWQVDTFSVSDATSMTWVSQLPDNSDHVLIKDGSRLIILDHSTAQVLATEDLSGKTSIQAYRYGYPHVLATDNIDELDSSSIPYQLYYGKSGEILSRVISKVPQQYSDSYLDVDNEILVVAVTQSIETDSDTDTNTNGVHGGLFDGEIYRYSISSGTSLDITEISERSHVAINSENLLIYRDSALGLVQRVGYDSGDVVEELSKFNLKILREKYE